MYWSFGSAEQEDEVVLSRMQAQVDTEGEIQSLRSEYANIKARERGQLAHVV